MLMLIKIVGVSTDAMSRLHAAIQDVKSTRFISIQGSKFDPEHKTYTVSLKVEPHHIELLTRNEGSGEKEDEFNVYHPLPELLKVFRAVDPELFPQSEQHTPTLETAQKIRKEGLHREKALCEDGLRRDTKALRGRTTMTDIVNHHGRVLLSTGETYTDQENEYSFRGNGFLELALPTSSTDQFVLELMLIVVRITTINKLDEKLKNV